MIAKIPSQNAPSKNKKHVRGDEVGSEFPDKEL